MRSFFSTFLQLLRRRRTAGRRSAGRPPAARRLPRLEGLEERNLLTSPLPVSRPLGLDQVQVRFDPNHQGTIQVSIAGYGTIAQVPFAPGWLESLSVSVPLARNDANAGTAPLFILVNDFNQTGFPEVTVTSGDNVRVAVGLPTGVFQTIFQQSAPGSVTLPPVPAGPGSGAPAASPGVRNTADGSATQPPAGDNSTSGTQPTSGQGASTPTQGEVSSGPSVVLSTQLGLTISVVPTPPALHRLLPAPPPAPPAPEPPAPDRDTAAVSPDLQVRDDRGETPPANPGTEPSSRHELDGLAGGGDTPSSAAVQEAFLDTAAGRGAVAVSFNRPVSPSGFGDDQATEAVLAAGNLERQVETLAVPASFGWSAPLLAGLDGAVRDWTRATPHESEILHPALQEPALTPPRLDVVSERVGDLTPQTPAQVPPTPLVQETNRRDDETETTRAAAHAPSPWVPLGGLLAQVFYLGNLKQVEAAPEAATAVEGLQAPADARLLVADLLQRSTEVFTQLIQSFYALFLGREAVAGEEQGWVGMLLAGRTQEDVLGAFLSTREFYDRAGVLVHTGTPDERYVQALHQVLLHRSAVPQEVSAYLTALSGAAAGPGRAVLPTLLVRSVEYRAQQIDAMYRSLLGRAAAAAETAAWAYTPFDLLTIRTFLVGHLSGVSRVPSAD